jgi:hypothetical protein
VLLRQVLGAVDRWIHLKVEVAEELQFRLQEDRASAAFWVFRAFDMARNHTRRATDRPHLGASPIRSL